MKTFKVKETYQVTVWTTVTAKTEDEAVKRIENDLSDTDFEYVVNDEYIETHWDTMEEVKK